MLTYREQVRDNELAAGARCSSMPQGIRRLVPIRRDRSPRKDIEDDLQ